jgi:hypothetical protein
VPGQSELAERFDLLEPFLDPVLAEVALAGLGRGPNRLGWKRLGNGDEVDVARGTPRPFGRRLDAAPNGREVLSNLCGQGPVPFRSG